MRMQFINHQKFGALQRNRFSDLDKPIEGRRDLRDILVKVHAQLTNVIKKLGDKAEYPCRGEFFKDMDKCWLQMKESPPLKYRYIVYGIDELPEKGVKGHEFMTDGKSIKKVFDENGTEMLQSQHSFMYEDVMLRMMHEISKVQYSQMPEKFRKRVHFANPWLSFYTALVSIPEQDMVPHRYL